MGRDGLAAQDGACDEVVELLSRICGRAIDAGALVPNTGCDDVADIWLKTYPAQYALQPLIAAASAFHRRNARQLSEISQIRSEEHTSELQSLMRISYAGFCFKKHTALNHSTHHAYSNHRP